LQQVKIPGQGGTTWTWTTIIGDRSAKELVGTPVALSPVQYDLWPTTGQASEGTVPYLRSHDNVTAHVVGDDPGDLDLKLIEAAKNPDGTIDCRKLVYFQWTENAAGEKRIPPRANGTSVIVLQREEDGATVYVRLSKTSSPVVQRFFSEVAKQGLLPFQTVVSLGLEKVQGKKAPYSRVVPKFVRALDPEFRDFFREDFERISPLLRGSLEKYPKVDSDSVPF
jgi:hypothetical protein